MFVDLPPGSPTTGSAITLDINAAGHGWPAGSDRLEQRLSSPPTA
jgi:hypothetical protein